MAKSYFDNGEDIIDFNYIVNVVVEYQNAAGTNPEDIFSVSVYLINNTNRKIAFGGELAEGFLKDYRAYLEARDRPSKVCEESIEKKPKSYCDTCTRPNCVARRRSG
jgi:hypothetical protein